VLTASMQCVEQAVLFGGRSNQPGIGDFRVAGCGAYKTIEEAQARYVCRCARSTGPKAAAVYEQLYSLYRDVYFALGRRNAEPAALGRVLPELRRMRLKCGRRVEI